MKSIFHVKPLKLAIATSTVVSCASFAGGIVIDMDFQYRSPQGETGPLIEGVLLEEGGVIIVNTSGFADSPTQKSGNCETTLSIGARTGYPFDNVELAPSNDSDYRLSQQQLVITATADEDGGLVFSNESFEIEILDDGESEPDEFFVVTVGEQGPQTTCIEYSDEYGDYYYGTSVSGASDYGDVLYVEITDAQTIPEEPLPPEEPQPPVQPTLPTALISRAVGTLEKQINTATTLAIETANSRNKNIARELARMRQTQGGISTDNLSVRLQGQSVSLGALGQGAGDISGPAWGAFLSGNIEVAEVEDDDFGSDFDASTLTGGVDIRLGNWVLGSALTLVDGKAEGQNKVSTTDVSQWGISAFGSYFTKNFYLNVIAAKSQSDYDFSQTIENDLNKGDAEGDEWSYALGGGYERNLEKLNLRAFFIYDVIAVDVDAFDYSGDVIQLATNDYSLEATQIEVGAYFSYTVNTSFGVLQPFVELSHNNLSRETKDALVIRYSVEQGSGEENMNAEFKDSDYAAIQVGLSAVFPGGVSTYLAYDTDLNRDDWKTSQYDLGVRWEF